MVDKFDWVKKYEDEELSLFSISDIKSFTVIQSRYREKYYKFFLNLGKQFNVARSSKELRVVDSVLESIRTVDQSIDRLLAGGNPKETEKLVQKVLDLMEQVEGAFMFFSRTEGLTKATRQRVADTEEVTGQSAGKMGHTSRVISQRFKKITGKPGLGKRFAEAAPEIASGIKGIGAGIAYGMLGPFGGFARSGVEAFKGYRARRAEKRETLEQQAFAKATLSGKETPEAELAARRQLFGVGRGRVPRDLEEGQYGASFFRAETPEGHSRAGLKRGGGSVNLVDALAEFYTGPAFRIPYTKRLLEAVEGLAGLKGGQEKKRELGLIGKAVAAIGTAAAIGAAVGTLIEKKVGKSVQTFFEKTVFGVDKSDFKVPGSEYATSRDAETALRMNLIQRGMDPKEAYQKAREQINRAREQTGRAGSKRNISVEIDSAVPLGEEETPIYPPIKPIPIDVEKGKEGVTTKGIDDLSRSFTDLKSELLKVSQRPSVKLPSGYDAWNNRNPRISALNSGILTTT